MADPSLPTIDAVLIDFHFLPVPLEQRTIRPLLEALIGPDKLFPAATMGKEPQVVLASSAPEMHDQIEQAYVASPHRSTQVLPRLSLPGQWWLTLKPNVWDETNDTPRQRRFWNDRISISVPSDPDLMVEHYGEILSAAASSGAVMVDLSLQDRIPVPPPGQYVRPPDSLALLRRQEVGNAVAAAVGNRMAMFGPWRGIAGVFWRLVLGREFAEMFGDEALAGVPDGLAFRDEVTGLWTLQTAEDPADSVGPEARVNERRIMEALGVEHFFDPETGVLPSVVPVFPREYLPDDAALD